MKKIVLLFALLGVIGLNVNAQSCPYSSKAKAGEKVAASAVTVDAALAAETNVQKRVCAKSGTVSYVRKDVCQKSGKVSYSDVEFCSKSGKFVNVSPSGMRDGASVKAVSGGATKKGCSASKKASCSKGAGAAANAKTVSGGAATAKKGCCASKKASCSKSVKAGSTEMAPKTKLVKAEK